MYKVEIDISNWGCGEEKITIETHDFFKIEQLQKFINFQQLQGAEWIECFFEDMDEEDELGLGEDDEDENEDVGTFFFTVQRVDEQTND